MDSKKQKRILIIVIVVVIIFVLLTTLFGERISDFTNGFITGLLFTLIVGALIVFGGKRSKK